MERDRLVMFIHKLILHHRNVRDILDSNGVRTLVDLMTLAHLHISRAVIPTQTNVIEAGPGMHLIQEQEWYYTTEETSRNGPVSFQEVTSLLHVYGLTKDFLNGPIALKTVIQPF